LALSMTCSMAHFPQISIRHFLGNLVDAVLTVMKIAFIGSFVGEGFYPLPC